MSESVETCVVGSGFGGLTIARALEAAGSDYLVLDKGRTPGGRAATRRFADSRFDHGLPWLNELGPFTKELIAEGKEAGVLEQAAGGNWFAPTGISSLGKHLAKGLKVRNRVRVTGILPEDDSLTLITETDGEESKVRVVRNLYLAMPLPQALELVEPLIGAGFRPAGDPFDKSIVGMVRLERDSLPTAPLSGRLDVAGHGTLVPDFTKFPDVEPGVSLRLTPEASDRLWDEDESVVKSYVSDVLESLSGPIPDDRIQVMKWRFANGSGLVKEPFHLANSGTTSIAICGDAFFGGQVEGVEAALRSASAAYDTLG